MILQKITIAQAEKLIKSKSIWSRVSEDGQTTRDFKLNKRDDQLWLGFFVENRLIGCLFFHTENVSTVVGHIQILEKYRKKHAYEAGRLGIKWFIKSNYRKMICQIPTIYQDVYHFTKKFGFLDEGINRASYKKNGRIHNQLRLGITKDEAKLWEQQQQQQQ